MPKKAESRQPGSDQQQEAAFEAANQMSLRGQMAADQLAGNKKSKAKKDVRKKDKSHGLLGDNKRVDGVFPDGDPHNKQEEAFQQAAEFEEKVKDSDLSFKRKASQVETNSDVVETDLDGGVMIAGEAREITAEFSIDIDDDPDNEPTALKRAPAPPQREETVTARVQQPAPPPVVAQPPPAPVAKPEPEPIVQQPSLRNVPEDTVPRVEAPVSETGLRKMLGLKTKAK